MHLSVARKNERLFTRKNVLFVLLLLAGSLSLLRDHEHARAHLPSRAVHDDGVIAIFFTYIIWPFHCQKMWAMLLTTILCRPLREPDSATLASSCTIRADQTRGAGIAEGE